MNPFLQSVEKIVPLFSHVQIDERRIETIAKEIPTENVHAVAHASPPFKYERLSAPEEALFYFVFNAVNFCYWGEPKWMIEYQGKEYGGAWGMMAALRKGLQQGIPLLSSAFLKEIPLAAFERIVEGNIPIPLCRERADILREVGAVLTEKYEGGVTRLITDAQGDCFRLVESITTAFPSYDDSSVYKGVTVQFHKRAQLFVAELSSMFSGKGLGAFHNIDRLAAFADYKIPAVLRDMGILVYAPELAHAVDSKTELSHGSEEEVEIRAGMVYASELLKHALQKRDSRIKGTDLDYWLWLEGKKNEGGKPHHRTRTTAY